MSKAVDKARDGRVIGTYLQMPKGTHALEDEIETSRSSHAELSSKDLKRFVIDEFAPVLNCMKARGALFLIKSSFSTLILKPPYHSPTSEISHF